MKKFLAVLLAMLMVVSFAACGKKEEAPKKEESKPLKVGCIGPTTGPYANYGLSLKQGAEVAFAEINAAGGINGRQVVFEMHDSQGDPESAVSAYGKLIDDGMEVSLGTVLSGEMASVVKASAQDDMFMISGSASADKCLEGSSNAFRLCFYDSYQGIAAADYVKKNFPGQKVAVFYESDIDYSVGLYEAFKAQATKNGTEVVEVQSFLKSDTDYSAQIDKLVASGAKVVFIPIYAEEASTFLTQAKNGTESAKFAPDVYFFGADGLDGILGKVAQAPKTADNVLMLTPFAEASTDPKVVSFVAAYKKAYGAVPDQFAADGYDVAYVVKAVVEAAGGSTKGADLTAQLLKLKFTGVTGTMTWNADGNTNKDAIAVVYKDGAGSVFGE
jgi:branched-chain amino acid transport system substrate-binding protein